MDLETENRIAAILLKEAAELRRQAQMEGTLAYLRQPTVRSRPNSRFLTATVLGVQQANRAVEVNEMWRLREKQLELDDRLGGKKDESNSGRSGRDVCESHWRSNMGCNEVESNVVATHSSKKRVIQDHLIPPEDEGLRDDEMEEFLRSRSKRGRGAVGSRIDDAGPYLPCPDSKRNLSGSPDEELRKARVLLGPEKPFSFKYLESSDYESLKDKRKKAKKTGSSKKHSRKHKLKGKSKDKKKKRPEEKKRKHRK